MNQTLTIIGCGATGMAAAYYFTRRGFRVLLCDTPDREPFLAQIRAQGGISLSGACGECPRVLPEALTTDFAQAMAHSGHVLMCAAADRQRLLAERCAYHVGSGHSILLCPGNFGALEVRGLLSPEVLLGELSDNLWPCRMTGPARVLVGLPLGVKTAAACPAGLTLRLLERWRPLLELKAGRNVLETALNSPNVISHVAGSVLNAAGVERSNGTFAFFADGLSPAVIRVLDGVERERDRVLEFLSLDAYASTAPLLNALMEGAPPGFEVFRTLDGPVDLKHRYISEDAQCGVALLLSVAEEYGLSVPVTRSALCLAECINDTSYLARGRTLARYGLKGRAPKELLALI